MGTRRGARGKVKRISAVHVEELVKLSRITQRMTFEQKLRLMEEAARVLRKGRPMKEVLRRAGEARGESR